MIITSLRQFILACHIADNNDDVYNAFEHDCTDAVRDQVFSLADADASEPFRSAMYNIGFTDY